MSYSIDVNILVYISDSNSPYHHRAASFLQEHLKNSELLCLSWITLMGYQRITTHPNIFPKPLTPQQAWKNIDDLLVLPQVRLISEGDDFAHHYSSITADFPVRGNLVPDAHLAAILKEHGVRTIYSADSDFRKFPFLKVINPLNLDISSLS